MGAATDRRDGARGAGARRGLKIPVLAEGIENPQLSVLSDEGCDEVQGFLLGRPMPLARIVDTGQIVLKAQAAVPVAAERARPEAEAPVAVALKA